MTLIRMTINILTQHNDKQQNNAQHNDTNHTDVLPTMLMLVVMALNRKTQVRMTLA